MKKLVFRNGIYSVLRPLYYVCKLFGLASYSYVADRRNKRVTSDYGYLNYIFTVIWLILFSVGLPVQILTLCSVDVGSKVSFIAYMLYIISSYTSGIVAVVWVSIIKRKMFLEVIENISIVDNKLRYTVQEETYMNRNVMFNIISEIILLTVINCAVIIYNIYLIASEPYYTIVIATIGYVPVICNALILFQFVNLVFMVKQRYSHLNNRLTSWLIGKVNRQMYLEKENERCIRSASAVDHVIVTPVCVSSVGKIERKPRQTDIHLLRQIYRELYDITCLINYTYGFPILAIVCCMLIGVVFSLYEVLIYSYFNVWLGENLTYGLTFMVLFLKVTFFCHTATNEARSSRILVEKLLLEGTCSNECVKELKMFSLQLQAMANQYTACGFFSLNLRLFASVVSVIVSYIVIMVQIK